MKGSLCQQRDYNPQSCALSGSHLGRSATLFQGVEPPYLTPDEYSGDLMRWSDPIADISVDCVCIIAAIADEAERFISCTA